MWVDVNIKSTGQSIVTLAVPEGEYNAVLTAGNVMGMKHMAKGQPKFTHCDLRHAEEQLGAMNATKAEAADSASGMLESLLASWQFNSLVADTA